MPSYPLVYLAASLGGDQFVLEFLVAPGWTKYTGGIHYSTHICKMKLWKKHHVWQIDLLPTQTAFLSNRNGHIPSWYFFIVPCLATGDLHLTCSHLLIQSTSTILPNCYVFLGGAFAIVAALHHRQAFIKRNTKRWFHSQICVVLNIKHVF